HLVDDDLDPIVLEHEVAVALLVERELVLEPGAAAPANGHPETRVRMLLDGEQCADLLGCDVGQRYHGHNDSRQIARYSRPRMPTAQELKERIETALPGATAVVEDLTGGGDHFRAEVVSDRFQGLSRIEQHRLVYDVFGAEIGGPIHALSLKTSTPQGTS